MVEKKPIPISKIRATIIIKKFQETDRNKQFFNQSTGIIYPKPIYPIPIPMKQTPKKMRTFYMSQPEMFVKSERELLKKRRLY